MTLPSDLEIASDASLDPIADVAAAAHLPVESLEPYGVDTAKISLDAIEAMGGRPAGRYILVSAITPTPAGEGKTTVTVGLGLVEEGAGSGAQRRDLVQ